MAKDDEDENENESRVMTTRQKNQHHPALDVPSLLLPLYSFLLSLAEADDLGSCSLHQGVDQFLTVPFYFIRQ